MSAWAWVLLAAYTLLSAGQQGIITWLFREYVPPGRQDWINAALHVGGVLIYALVVLVIGKAYGVLGRGWLAYLGLAIQAVLVRWLLFDFGLNLARNWFNHREGRPAEPLTALGTSAGSDRLTRWLAGKVGLEPGPVRWILYVLALVLSVLSTYLF